MNYIHQLEDELKEARAELVGLKSGLHDMERYINLPKFYEDPTVQVQDIRNRIEDARRQGEERSNDQARINYELRMIYHGSFQ